MAGMQLGGFLHYLRQRLAAQDDDSVHLLERFVQERDEDAFAALLGRFGPLVLRVCRQVLGDEQDVEDAFQAAFIVLAHKAGTIRKGELLASWLHGVAYRVALEARTRKARRRQMEEKGTAMHSADPLQKVEWQELGPVLHEEVNRLPAKYRQPIVLCYLDGQTHEQAAGRLGWPIGTVRTRLSRGRDMLQGRLVRRGVTLSTGAFSVILDQAGASAAVPPLLLQSTLQSALLVTAGHAASAAGISAGAATLVKGVMHNMFLSKLKLVVAILVVVGIIGGGLGLILPVAETTPTSHAGAPAALDPTKVKADQAAVVKGNTRFAFDLYGKLRQDKGNLFLSPYSISTALAMTSSGARKETLSQMEKTLRFPVQQPRLHPAFGSLQKATKGGKGYQLHVANALWCQTGYPFVDDFLSLNENFYGGKPVGVDYIRRTEEARKTINGWVEKQTKDKIKELLKPGILDGLTRIVLTNAIYFKGDWAHPFDKKLTRDAPFQLAAGDKVKVPMMNRTGKYNYFRDQTLQGLELPYADDELSMVVFLPQKADGLAAFEKTITAEKLTEYLGKLKPINKLRVTLPRFKVTAEFRLNDVLKDLGMSDAFTSGVADFSGISPVARKEGWYITHVIHKAFVDVNEEGTEAAGSTAVVIGAKSLPPSFRADRPFFFVIRDKRTDSILFMGRVEDPRSKDKDQ